MGIGSIFKKIGESIKKSAQKLRIESERRERIRCLKEKYLSRLSHRELVQIYRTYIEESAW